MAADDLNAPLGRDPNRGRRKFPGLSNTLARLAAGLLGLALAVFVSWALFTHDPNGGEPVATVALPAVADIAAKSETADAAKPEVTVRAEAPPLAEGPGVVTIIDGSTGQRQSVQLPSAESTPGAGDPRLLEQTRHGLIPKISADGTRPSDAYAMPRAPPDATDAPRIAIIVSGLGIGTRVSETAISRLPNTVTLAFVPYGKSIEEMVGKARETGREVLLQIPMEPADYPDNDPGPQTLLTSLPPEQNIDRLHWALSRARSYVGIMNYMGARLSAHEASLSPVLREAGRRGLIYVDDAASARSVAAQIAGTNNVGFAKADVVIDAIPTSADIGKALTRLEGIAKANGVAIGVASALPVTIERLSQWSKSVGSRGFILVPVSVAAGRSKSS